MSDEEPPLSEWWAWWYDTHGGRTSHGFPIVGLWTPEAIRRDQDFLRKH